MISLTDSRITTPRRLSFMRNWKSLTLLRPLVSRPCSSLASCWIRYMRAYYSIWCFKMMNRNRMHCKSIGNGHPVVTMMELSLPLSVQTLQDLSLQPMLHNFSENPFTKIKAKFHDRVEIFFPCV